MLLNDTQLSMNYLPICSVEKYLIWLKVVINMPIVKEILTLPRVFFLYSHTITTLTTLLTPDGWVFFPPQQVILYNINWVSYNSIHSDTDRS